MSAKQIFGMDVVEDPRMPPGTWKLAAPLPPYDDVFVSYAGMTFVRKMTRDDFAAMQKASPSSPSPLPDASPRTPHRGG